MKVYGYGKGYVTEHDAKTLMLDTLNLTGVDVSDALWQASVPPTTRWNAIRKALTARGWRPSKYPWESA